MASRKPLLAMSLSAAGFLCNPAAADLVELNSEDMSSIAARDGLTLLIDSPTGVTADSITWRNDKLDATNRAGLVIQNMVLESLTSNPVQVDIDAGANAGTPFARLGVTWDELGLELNALRLEDASGNLSAASAGEIAFFSTGGITLVNEGIFNGAQGNAQLDLRFSEPTAPGDFILRQGGPGSPEFSFGNANLRLQLLNCSVGNCTLGVDDVQGVFL